MNFNYPTYLVGGAVRDELLGLEPKDRDYVMVVPSFDAMEKELLSQGCKIFVRKPEFLTIRCNHPKLGAVDFACARKDGNYSDGRRPDSTSVAENLEQDLARRDFTCNAMAKSLEHGRILDPFHGQHAIDTKQIISVGNPLERFEEDKLRAFRAIRFAVTKDFGIDLAVRRAINSLTSYDFHKVSTERIREELLKAFECNWYHTFQLLQNYMVLGDVIDLRGIWFKPTTEQ